MTNGWTPERRARQAELIRQWRPWEKSTGPKTEAGKRVTSQNAYKGGIEPLVRGLWSVLRVGTQAAYKGDNGQSLLRGLLYVLRKHHQQQEYSRQLRKGDKPEVERPSADLRPDWMTQAIDQESPPDAEQVFDDLRSYLKQLAIQYPVSFLGLVELALRIEGKYRSTVFHLYIKNGNSTKLIFSSGSEDPPASKSPP